MTTPKNYSWIWEWLFILILIIILTILIGGCREARELKKDDKAFTRVIGQTRPNLTKKTDAALDKIFPCQNYITKTEYKKGDTVKVPQLVFDSLRVNRFLDSLKWFSSLPPLSDSIELMECNRLIAETYNTAYKSAVWECNQKKPQIRVDTFNITIKDNQELDFITGQRDVLDGMYQQSEKQAKINAEVARNRLYWLIGICSGIGLLLFGFIWSKFKKPLKK